MSETIHVNAFQANLHGSKILCQGPFQKNKVPPVLEAIQNIKIPFKKRVLLTNSESSLFFHSLFTLPYDATFHIHEVTDWSLALTYILHAPKDVLVIAEDLPIPDAVWPKLPKTVTFISVVTTPLKNLMPYEAVFFAPTEDLGTFYATDTIYKAVLALTKKPYGFKEYKEILQELRVANAGLAFIKGSETLFWYDPIAAPANTVSKKDLSDVCLWLARNLSDDGDE